MADDERRPNIACPNCQTPVPLIDGIGEKGDKWFRCPSCGLAFGASRHNN